MSSSTEEPASRPSDPLRQYVAGQRIAAKYELTRLIGEGGMGSVWVARNIALETNVAIKLIRAEIDSEEAGERLLQEARAAARLGHRAIVRVFDYGHTDQGDPFIVMELLEGETLADVLATRGRLSPAKAVQTLLPVIDALATAHERGIIHRDLKPENIFLSRETRRTQPKVVDFGIAKVDQQVARRTLTRQGTILGSPGYMSPEQARGRATVDRRSDVWAISVVLYECITGRAAFEGDNYNALMRAIIEDPVVPVTELAAGDAALWAILEQGLKKEPSERWDSMRDLGRALATWLLEHEVDHDVCGEPLSSYLEVAESARSRDLLSVPPPSMDMSRSSRPDAGRVSQPDTGRTSRPGVAQTLNGPPQARVSDRPSPTSTSAMVSSRAPIAQKPALAFGLGAAALVSLLAILIFYRTPPAVQPPTPPARVAAAPAPAPVAVAAPRPAPVAAAPAPAVEEPKVVPTSLPRAAAPPVAGATPKTSPRPAAKAKTKTAGSSRGPVDLKDPY